MAHLDRTQPYSVVYGEGTYKIAQSGKLFHPNGTEVGHGDESTPEVPIDVLNDVVRNHENGPMALEDMHWTELQALIESYGGQWINKEAAVEFLRGMM